MNILIDFEMIKFWTEIGLCLGTVLLAVFTLLLWLSTKKLANDSDTNAKAQVEEAKRAVQTAQEIHQEQLLLSQRQLLVNLWECITSMDPVKPEDLVQPDVRKAVNALELIALCCEGGMIDESVIKRTFSHIYMRQYEAISRCPAMDYFGGKDGNAVLAENGATQAFYEKLKREHMDRGKLTTFKEKP